MPLLFQKEMVTATVIQKDQTEMVTDIQVEDQTETATDIQVEDPTGTAMVTATVTAMVMATVMVMATEMVTLATETVIHQTETVTEMVDTTIRFCPRIRQTCKVVYMHSLSDKTVWKMPRKPRKEILSSLFIHIVHIIVHPYTHIIIYSHIFIYIQSKYYKLV